MGELQICNSTMKLRKLPVVWVVRVTPRFWVLLVIPKFGVSVATITTFVTVDAFTPLGERYYDNHNTYRTGKAHQPD
nr:MAG TPA: hypothetical protein [Caudoviricetes sp.]